MNKRILIIDDDQDLLDVLEGRLELEGYEIKTLSDPSVAERTIDEYVPGLLIIDVFMPERTGFNLLEDFREKGLYLDIPKIFLTGLKDEIEKMVALGMGAVKYLTKPFEYNELILAINEALQ